MEDRIAIVMVILLTALGISHILQPRAWVDFFVRLREQGKPGILMVGILHLQPAILIVAFHNRWSGLPLILTLIGWGWLIKGSLYLMFPRVGLMSIGRVSIQRSHEFVIGGVVLLVLTALIAIPLLRPLIG